MSEIFSPTELDRQLHKLEDLPSEEGGVGVVARNGDVGVEGSLNKRLGKSGAFVQVDGSWMRRAGYSVAAWFGWKGK